MPETLRIRAEEGRVIFVCPMCQKETWQPAYRMASFDHEYVVMSRVPCTHCPHWIDFDLDVVKTVAEEAARLADQKRTS